MKKTNKLISILIAVAMLLSMAPISVFAAAAPPTVEIGGKTYYEIDSADDLDWFAAQVNSGNTAINASLTKNITYNSGTMSASTTGARVWTPVGTSDNPFTGIFNGNGYTISGLYCKDPEDSPYLSLVAHSVKAIIANVAVTNFYFESRYGLVAGIASYAAGSTITNCYAQGSIYAKDGGAAAAGICAAVFGHSRTEILNCLADVALKVDDPSDFTVSGSSVRNYIGGIICTGDKNNPVLIQKTIYITDRYNGPVYDSDYALESHFEIYDSEGMPASKLSTGEIAYALGNGWGQKLGTDPMPVILSADKVNYGYISCDVDAEKVYTNSAINPNYPWHYDSETDSDSACDFCGINLHIHSFEYTASGDTITAVCENTDGNCTDTNGGTLTILAPADLYVDGTAKEATIENNLVDTSVAISDITYSAPYGLPPKDAGTYTASVTVGGATATVEFTLLNYAAKVTDKDGNAVGTYKTFAEAVTAASESEGSTLTLLDDITLTETAGISSGKFILDLNGKTILNKTDNVLMIYHHANITIKDSREGGTVETGGDYCYGISNLGELTVESGTIKGNGSGISNHGTLTVNGGNFESYTYGAITNKATAKIYGGVFEGIDRGEGIQNDANGEIYIYGGKISGDTALLNNGTAYISGGEIISSDYAALNIVKGTVEVTGGSFTGTDFSDGYFSGTPYGEWTIDINESATLILKGGEFPNGFVIDETTANTLLAEGYAFYDKDGNKISVADDAKIIDGYVQVKEHFIASVTDKDGNEIGTYNTLADAITAAQGSEGSTLTLIDDCNVSYYVEITSGTFTFDLAGNSLTISGSNTAFFVDGSDVNLTIADSIGGGKIYASSMSLNMIAAQCVTINNGIFDGYISLRNGSLIINGGTFNNGSEGGYSISDDDGTTVVIYGGEFPKGFYLPRTDFLNDFIAEGCYFRDADGKIINVADNISVIKGYVKVTKGADLADAVITLDSTEFTYTGSEIKPTVIVTVVGKAITEGKDYTLTFANNVNAGKATVTVKGTGDYTGEVTREFTIVKADNTVNAAPTPNTLTYNGEAHNLISAGEASFGTMVYSLDGAEYSETIPQGTDAGDYTVYYKVIGDSNHNDTEPATVIVTINAKDISDGSIILGEALTYNGTEQTQTVEKVLTTNNLEATYTVSGNKATNVGVYLLTVTGTGNFTGEAKIAYEIAVDMNGVDFDKLHPLNVKATDKEKIEYIYNQLDNAFRDYADAEKRNEWDNNKSYCVELLKMIESVANHIESFKNKLAEYDIDTVTSDDSDDLESFYNDEVSYLYDNYFDNLTEEQTKELDDILSGISALQKRISDVAKEITRITNAANDYDEATVKSTDKDDIEQLKADIKALTEGQNLTDEERADLAELDAKLDALLKKIADTKAEIDRVNEIVNAYDEETVKSTDKEDLAQLKEDIQALIDSTNTTENEKTTLEEMIKDIEGLEDKITETEEKLEEIKDIENNFNPETVSSEDKAAIEDKIAEIEAVNPDNLTDEQREEYEEIKAGFEALLEEIAAAEKNVADIGTELEMFDEKRVTKFWEDDIEALKAKIDELLTDENMGEAEKAKLDEYKAQAEKLIEIINTPKEYFSIRFFYLIWDAINWLVNRIVLFFNRIF